MKLLGWGNSNGLVQAACLTHASGHGEREVALTINRRFPVDDGALWSWTSDMTAPKSLSRSVGLRVCRCLSRRNLATIVVQSLDCATRHCCYAVGLRIRARIKTYFGWLNSVASMRQVKQCGID
jgi:hypothetical protein